MLTPIRSLMENKWHKTGAGAGLLSPAPRGEKRKYHSVKSRFTPYLFILPALAIYGSFVIFPIIRLIYLSFQEWDGIDKNPKWIGLDNYKAIFVSDEFWEALGHNLWWVLLASIPIILGIALAVLLHYGKPRGRNVYRMLVFLPYTLSVVVSSVMWKWIYHGKTGALNELLRLIGLGQFAHGWLGDPNTALTALALAGAWTGYGFCMVLFLAGLANIDTTLYDAARVDGANAWQQFIHVTIPGLANTMNVVIVIVFIATMRVFDFVKVTTEGGPLTSTEVLATLIYRQTFQYFNVGYGAALSVVTMIIILVASLLYLYLRERGSR